MLMSKNRSETRLNLFTTSESLTFNIFYQIQDDSVRGVCTVYWRLRKVVVELYLWFSIIVSHPSEDGGGRGG